ncbi:PREDICTED: methylosome protein 50-like [Ceratosolen solmsi marchali]|uniref:Methylosome protein 50-like n=1 Tax=Ceratosolen solmsi marchali TaxID=326594 RepID=A0AAJ6VLS7_9HYME|nr:PREDICTED: methylosome protein 50-like [Ceratosolen solmsi marchali]
MELQDEQIDPNLNADVYRNMTASNRPMIQDKQLEVVLVYKDDSLILGASNMVDRYWNGTVWFYSEINNFDRNQYIAATRTESGVRVATYLGKYDRFVIGEDSGLIQIFELVLKSELKCMGYTCQHDDSLTSMSTFNNNTHIVTAGMDSCIKVWDMTEIIAIYSFNQAQTDIITSTEVQVDSDAVFLSTSMDCEALLWDIRKSKPALGLWKNECGLTASSWQPNNENIVAVGGLDGIISILDIRRIGETPLYETPESSRGIRNLLFDPDQPSKLASCYDNTEVKIFDISNDCKNIFTNDEHADFVRGLAWHKSDLITCSWDNTVVRHIVSDICT